MIAVLKRRLHKDIDRHDLREGSYIVLKEYRLATGPRLNGIGEVQYVFIQSPLETQADFFVQRYIAILDFYVIGNEGRFEFPSADSEGSTTTDQRSRATSIPVDERHHDLSSLEQYDTVRSNSVIPAASADVDYAQSDPDKVDTENADAYEHNSVDTLLSFPTPVASISDDTANILQPQGIEKKRKRDVVASQTDSGSGIGTRSPSKKVKKQAQRGSKSNEGNTTTVSRQTESPWARKAKAAGTPLQPIERPLRLSMLASVTGVNRSRNKVVDILALVHSVDDSTVKPVHLPLKRDIRITDGSTDRPITVSIFVDPVDCVPSVGEIVLFRNLVTHDWKQGALNAYPKYCDGKDWYIPDPERVEGRGLELKDLKAKILATEQERCRSVNVGDKETREDGQSQKRRKYS